MVQVLTRASPKCAVERAPAQLCGTRQRRVAAPLALRQHHGDLRRRSVFRGRHEFLHVPHHFVGVDAHGQELVLRLSFISPCMGRLRRNSRGKLGRDGLRSCLVMIVTTAVPPGGRLQILANRRWMPVRPRTASPKTPARARWCSFSTAPSPLPASGSTRDGTGRRRLLRTYTFDYTHDGFERSQGFIVLPACALEAVGLADSPS